MAAVLRHRGPDDQNGWADAAAGVAFGFRRLAIVDLSPAGRQPMVSASGRYRIVCNGEIYNFRALRRELESPPSYPFRGQGDTEVLLAAIERWGIDAALRRTVGMFAFAVWDGERRVLHLARDRAGERPLYYGCRGNVFLFGSELKALRAYSDWRGEVDRDALTLYMRHGYIPAPYSIYRGVFKLPPGTRLEIDPSAVRGASLPQPVSYWSAKEMVEAAALCRRLGAGHECRSNVDQLDSLLRNIVAGQMVADVPVGAFLSGGIDSSTIVALMQAQCGRPVRTFSIGFHESGYNEASYAKAVARHLGTEHTELYVTPSEAGDVVHDLPTIYDEPFADSSQIPTYLVSRLARRQVTVSLSGDGGDELFQGYERYVTSERLWRQITRFPAVARHAAARTARALRAELFGELLSRIGPRRWRRGGEAAVSAKIERAAELLRHGTFEEFYRSLVSQWTEGESVVLGGEEPTYALTNSESWPTSSHPLLRAAYIDLVGYLPDDILVKVDRAAMAVSLETRAPLLDHRVMEFAWRLPAALKRRDGQAKWVLRKVLARYVPPALTERPKMGFGVPIGDWLRGPWRDWAEALLDPPRLRAEGYLDSSPIRRIWEEHLSGRRDRSYQLWNVLMFQAWTAAAAQAAPRVRKAA